MANRIYKVETPDGKVIQIEGPEDATDDELIATAEEHLANAVPDTKYAKPVVNRPKPTIAPTTPTQMQTDALAQYQRKPGLADLAVNGASFGLSDEIMGAGGAVANALSAPFTGSFDPVGAYTTTRDLERRRLDDVRQDSPVLGALSEVAGAFAGGRPAAVAAEVPNVLAAIRGGARMGAVAGGVGGFGSGEGAEGSLLQGALGGAFGGVLGGLIPAATIVGRNALSGINRFLGRDQAGLARRLVGDALAGDANTPLEAGATMSAANALGVPRMLADTGENARSLAASVARQPGPSRTIVRDAVIERQMGQGGRVRNAIARDLGPIENTFEVSDRLGAQARATAAPLYDQAYSLPLTVPEDMAGLMARPSVQRALRKARSIAAEEGRNPSELGFVETADGAVELPNAPSLQTYDYVKRGLDDVLEGYRDTTTGRLALDTEGRAIENTRRELVAALDNSGEAGEAYRSARAAYAGPASARQALQAGKSALNLSDEELERTVARLGENDRAQFALGYRSALAEQLDRRVDGADKVGAMLGSPRKRAALQQLFGGEDGFDRFIQTMNLERAGNETYRAVATGSQTANRLADDAQTADSGLAEAALDVGIRGAQGGGLGILSSMLAHARQVGAFGVGEAGNRVRESVASLLTETDPATLRQIVEEANRTVQRQRALIDSSNRAGVGLGGRTVQGLTVAAGSLGGQ